MDRASRVAPSRVGVDVPCRAVRSPARSRFPLDWAAPGRGSYFIFRSFHCESNDANKERFKKFKPRGGSTRSCNVRAPELEPNAQT